MVVLQSLRGPVRWAATYYAPMLNAVRCIFLNTVKTVDSVQ